MKKHNLNAAGGPIGPVKTTYYGNLHNKKPYEKIQRTVQQPNRTPSQPLGARDFANYAEPLIGKTILLLYLLLLFCNCFRAF